MHEVHMGSFFIDKAPAVLAATGLGSCVAVVLYDPEKKIGGLGHIMRPNGTIPAMVSAMLALGVIKDNIHAKIVGGANMFPDDEGFNTDIGAKNITAAEFALKELGIHVASRDTGGHIGKTVYFDLTSGLLDVRFKM